MAGDVPAATAILDRFLERAELIQITGKSYRLRNRTGKDEKSDGKQAEAVKTDQSARRVEPAAPVPKKSARQRQ